MPVLTEEILKYICYGKRDSKTKRVSGGHIHDALKNGGGKKFHTEFPADWTVETVREAFYHVIQTNPAISGTSLRFNGTYLGVRIKIEYDFGDFVSVGKEIHMYPVEGPGVRAWKNGKPYKVSQKRQK